MRFFKLASLWVVMFVVVYGVAYAFRPKVSMSLNPGDTDAMPGDRVFQSAQTRDPGVVPTVRCTSGCEHITEVQGDGKDQMGFTIRLGASVGSSIIFQAVDMSGRATTVAGSVRIIPRK